MGARARASDRPENDAEAVRLEQAVSHGELSTSRHPEESVAETLRKVCWHKVLGVEDKGVPQIDSSQGSTQPGSRPLSEASVFEFTTTASPVESWHA